jgi:dTDP-4-dehydrorhamnose reductase
MLLVGARGFLGRFVRKEASPFYDVVRADRSLGSGDTDILLDVTSKSSIEHAFRSVQPQVVVLLAAISDIDRCEREPEQTIAVNRDGAARVAQACAEVGARLLFTSTGAVFDGKKIGYTEDDPVTPISVYGRSKAEAECLILTALPTAIVLRVSLVLGRTNLCTTNSLVDNLIWRWASGDIVNAPTSESRNPIDARTLARWIVELLQNPHARGIYNAGSTDAWTRYEIARALAAGLAIPESQVRQAEIAPQTRAPRGAHQLLLPHKLASVCVTQPPTSRDVIERSLYEPAQGDL